jgi:hypothetical protein
MNEVKKTLLVFGLIFGLAGFLPLCAEASVIYGTVWTSTDYGNGGGQSSDLTNGGAVMGSLNSTNALGTFTLGTINLYAPSGSSPTYSQFLSGSTTGGNPNNLQVLTGNPVTVWGATLQSSGTVASIFQFTGEAYFSQTFTFTADDGLDLYLNGALQTSTPSSSTPSSPEARDYSIAKAGVYSFTINYAAWNGMPEELKLTAGTMDPVAEPSTLLLLGAAIFGFGLVFRRRFAA